MTRVKTLVKIPVKPEAVGRYKTDKAGRTDFDFLREDLVELGYLDKKGAATRKSPGKPKRRRAVPVA